MSCISDIVQLLLAHNAPVKVKNVNGWTPLAEAVSYGDRITSKFLLLYFHLCYTFQIKLYGSTWLINH